MSPRPLPTSAKLAIVTPTLVLLLLAVGIASFPNRSLSRTESAGIARTTSSLPARPAIASARPSVAVNPADIAPEVKGVSIERDTTAKQIAQLRALLVEVLKRLDALEHPAH